MIDCRALELLVKQEKDGPDGHSRPACWRCPETEGLVIRNGGIAAVIETSDEERQGLGQLTALDKKLSRLRDQVRHGERIIFDLQQLAE